MTKDDKRGSVGHTPGLWRVQPIDRDFAVIASVDGITWQIAEVYDTGPNEESTAKANAAHIVRCVNAFDAMRDALQLVWGKVLTEYHSRDSYVRKQVEAALALAQPTPETEGR